MNRSAVIFDLDGTITKPYLDFDAVRAEIGVEGPVLEAMAGMDPASRRVAAGDRWTVNGEHEMMLDSACESSIGAGREAP